MVFFTYMPCCFIVPVIRSLTIGTQPPQPVPAFVHFLTPSSVVQPASVTEEQIAPLLTASQEQISASSGKLITHAPSFAPPLLPRIASSGSGGNINLLFTVCNNIL